MTEILIVDDEPEMVMVARAMLEKAGYGTDDAWNGEECLERLKEKKYDLILLDVMMPGDDGWEVCRKIKADDKTKDIPIVMFTVRTSSDSVKKGRECGAAAQVNKPFDGTELIDTVKDVLEKEKS